MPRALFLICFLLSISGLMQAQTVYDQKINGNYKQKTILDILQDFETQITAKFYFDPQKLPYYKLDMKFNDRRLYDALQELFYAKGLVFSNFGADKIVITRKDDLTKEYAESLIARWDAGQIELPNLNEPQEVELTIGQESAQLPATVRFSGKILDGETKEPIIGATLTMENGEGTATDAFGAFVLSLKPGQHTLMLRYIGYQPIALKLSIYKNGEAEFNMAVNALQLDEVIVKAEAADQNIKSAQIGVEALTPQTIKELPTFLGEADVIKSLQTLPGVSTVGEGATGFNVRGGSIDQNLILQDEGLVFNSSHVLGFFSTFNPDVIRNVTLYKGNIPAQYGGRLSSVLDVQLKDGNFKNLSGTGGIGLVSSRLVLEGPLQKNKTSFLVGGRASYSDWLLRRVKLPDAKNSSAYFYDVVGKLTHRFGSNGDVSLSYYNSYDFFRFAEDFGFTWRTQLANFQWKQIWADRLSSTFSGVWGDYSSTQFDPGGVEGFSLANGLKYYKGKQNFFYAPSSMHAINAGLSGTLYDMHPEDLSPKGNSSGIASQYIDKDQGYELAVYANDEITLNPILSLSLGVRYARYQSVGPSRVFVYNKEIPRRPNTVIDTIFYQSGDKIQSYGGWEPRISMKVQLSENSSVKLSYNRMQQFIHLISNSAAATPVDIWQVSNTYFRPQLADNYSLGYFKNFSGNLFETSIEGYYRSIENQLGFKDLPKLLLNEQLETEVLSGEGRAYGIELYLKKNSGRWSGWFSYAYARAQIQIAGNSPEETINNGKWFSADYDQPHQATLFVRNEVTPTQVFTANFTYRTGRPITAPIANYLIGTAIIPQFSDRNQYRIPDYHRLDLAYTFDNTKAKLKGFSTSFTVAIYNVYFRKNPFSVFFKRDSRNIPQAYQLAVLGTAFPSVTWNFKF